MNEQKPARAVDIEELERQLLETRETLDAIRRGAVDAIVVSDGSGQQVFTLKGADHIYRILVEEMNEGAATLSSAGTVLYCNKRFARVLGRSSEQAISRSLESLVPRRHKAAIRELVAQASHRRVKTEIQLSSASGPYLTILFSLNPFRIDQEQLISVIATDISDQKAMEARLLESERMAAIGNTAATIVHELSQPLDGMYTTCQLIELTLGKRAAHDAELPDMIRDFRREVERLTRLLAELRHQGEPHPLNLMPVDILPVIREILSLESQKYAASRIRAHVEAATDLPKVEADPAKLKQVLLNLFTNACEAMTDGGELRVRIHAQPGAMIIDVIDTGAGVPETIDPFGLFTTTKPQGSGLGLTLVRQIVQRHGGTVQYDREDDKTRFRVRLPILL